MTEFRWVAERPVHVGSRISLSVVTVEGPGGDRFDREFVPHPGAVAAVPARPNGRGGWEVACVRQYRFAIDDWLLELPAGLRDEPGEDPLETAKRELAEETGFDAAEWHLLGRFHMAAGFTNEDMTIYLATGLVERPGGAEAHSPEEAAMTLEWVDLDSVEGRVAAGELPDAKTVIGLTLARTRLGSALA